MEFEEILEQAITLLQGQGRVSYGALKRRFKLDDDYLEDLKIELIEAQRLAVDENSRILVWTGDQSAAAFEQALVALQHFPDRRDTREQAIDLRFDLRNALYPLGESGRILDHLRQAEPLAKALGDRGRLVQVTTYMAACLRELGDLDGALESAQRALAIATALGDVGLQVAAHAIHKVWIQREGKRAYSARYVACPNIM